MNEAALLEHYLLIGAILFALGLIGMLVRRNLIVMFLCAEMMLQGISLSLVGWSRYHDDWGGQMLVVFILTVAACEAGIALALVMTAFGQSGSLDSTFWQQLREEDQKAYVDQEIPVEEDSPRLTWPKLTPAGIEPAPRPEEETHRSHV
jgi:NADH-quinone oxidoreductase subunit K